MNLGSFPTRFERWGRAPAIALLAALAAVFILAAWPTASAPQPRVRASQAEQGDLDLYRDIIARVGAGEPYYSAAADELRKGGYPLKPFFTFRLPTLAMAHAYLSVSVMIALEALLALAVLIVWWRRLEKVLPLRGVALALVLFVAGSAALLQPATALFHESWAALLMALMVGLRRPGHAAWAMLAGALALAVRETALPMVLAMGGLALLERRWREALGWTAIVALFALALFFHAEMVASVVRPADPASPGWSAALGPRFALASLARVSSATALPIAAAAVAFLLSLFGWLSVATGWALRASLLLLGYATMLALFARPDTFYWALLAAPLSLVGMVFVPRALAVLVRAALGMAQLPA